MTLTTLFVDMNAYFASVEQQVRPELRHRPVAVVPMITDNTCCIAVSYEAKRFGIKTGTQVGAAKRMCPDLRIVEARPDLYVEFHHAVIAAVESCLHVDAVHSIDEMSCRLMGTEREPAPATELARRVKETIRRQVGDGMRCSVGLASNRLLAKVASDMEKPDGLIVITSEELPQRLYGLDLSDLPGIGLRMKERLRRHGIVTVEQLCGLSQERLRSIWQSVLGRQWWHWLRGHDLPDQPTHRRTVGHSHVLPPKLRNRADAQAVLIRLIHRAAARLRHLRCWARSMMVYVAFLPKGKWKDRIGLGLCQDTVSMVEAFCNLWERCPSGTPLQVGVTLFNLVADESATLPLFTEERDRIKLAHVMDRLHVRFGAHTIYLADMHEVRESAPRRISFTSIPRLDPTEY